MQEEQTGKKRQEKLEWMYSTPATGGNQNPNDLEDYLLGKKRVDKVLAADDAARVRPTQLDISLIIHNSLALARCISQELHCRPKRQYRSRYRVQDP